ncbi:MAG: hypothetical protein L3J96_02760 [Thermoplasmata archaeon]|nr:hypothetical protein [Thermoplasmata archaeon]
MWKSAVGPTSAVVGILLGVLLLTMGTHGTINPAVLFGAPSPSAHLSAAQCAADDSNATLIEGVVYLYQGNGNASGSGSGLINQVPPGFGAYPSESVAEINVINGWLSICQSSAFYELVQQWGPQNNTWDGLDQNSTGVYEDVFTVTWNAPGSSCTPNPGPNEDCFGAEVWLLNVASGAISGPAPSFYAPQAPGGAYSGTAPAP